ncbi:MAG: cupin domain-containing protein [Candidatus Nanopelagicales bacterium]
MSSLDEMTADEVIESLGLEYLEGEGVWFRLLWRTDHGNAIYGLLTPDDFSALHLLAEDEMWVHVAGAPVEMLHLHPDGTHAIGLLGVDIGAGESPAVLVPAHSWQGARTLGDWSLVVCSLAPPFSGFTLATPDTDLGAWPAAAASITRLIRG